MNERSLGLLGCHKWLCHLSHTAPEKLHSWFSVCVGVLLCCLVFTLTIVKSCSGLALTRRRSVSSHQQGGEGAPDCLSLLNLKSFAGDREVLLFVDGLLMLAKVDGVGS